MGEFRARIQSDHLTAVNYFTNSLSWHPLAFFFPKGNYGQYEPHNRMLRATNLELVAESYKLGFIIDGFGYNDARSDCRRLNRLKVEPAWDAQELIRRLDGVWPHPMPGGWDSGPEEGVVTSDRWRAIWGMCDLSKNWGGGDGVFLLAKPPDDTIRSDAGSTTGAKAWITGSNGFAEGSFEVTFRILRGGFTINLHYAAEDDVVALTIGTDGAAVLSRTVPGCDSERLAVEFLDAPRQTDREHTITAVSRRGSMFVLFDGRLLFGGGVNLGKDPPRAGFVGAGVWSTNPGEAATEIISSRLRAHLPRFAVWETESTRSKAEVFAELERQAFRYDMISPPWLSASDGASGFQLVEDADAIKLVAAKVYCGVWPSLRVSGRDPFSTIPRETAIEAYLDGGFEGLYIDARDLETDSLSTLRDWVINFRKDCDTTNEIPVAVRLPPSFAASTLAPGYIDSIPGAILAAPDGAVLPPVLKSKVRGILTIAQTEASSEAYYRLAEFDAKPADSTPGEEDFIIKAERALSERKFGEADAFAKRWVEARPESAAAWEYMARVRVRESREADSITAYRKTLELDPANIAVATAFADYLVTTAGREEEARDILDTYARAFPLNREIALAQARWLNARGMRPEACTILRDWVSRQEGNIDLRVILHAYLQSPQERYNNIHDIIDMVAYSWQNLMWFRRKIDSSGLLTYPESSATFDFIRDNANNSRNGVVRKHYAELMPIESSVIETFKDGRLSSNWELIGSSGDTIPGEYLLPGLPDPAEAHLRLYKSDLLRDGYIEATIGESLGAFWLYARRSTLGMVRFGFDSDGFLRVQAWQNGEPRVLDGVLWMRPKVDLALRLEIRGDGVICYFNGERVFSTPLEIPRELGYGWWGIASSASETGMAQTRVKALSAGPLGPTLVVLDCVPTKDEYGATKSAPMRKILETLREKVYDVSVVAPIVCHQREDGALARPDETALALVRVFASYHRLRLMPLLSLDYYNEPKPEVIIKYMKDAAVDGLCLRVRRMPSDAWIAEMEKALETTFANIIIFETEKLLPEAAAESAPTTVRELQRGSLMLQVGKVPWESKVETFENWANSKEGTRRLGSKPAMVVMPRGTEDEDEKFSEQQDAEKSDYKEIP